MAQSGSSTTANPTTASWYYDEMFGVVHPEGTCSKCHDYMVHVVRHRSDRDYQSADNQRRNHDRLKLDDAVSRITAADAQRADKQITVLQNRVADLERERAELRVRLEQREEELTRGRARSRSTERSYRRDRTPPRYYGRRSRSRSPRRSRPRSPPHRWAENRHPLADRITSPVDDRSSQGRSATSSSSHPGAASSTKGKERAPAPAPPPPSHPDVPMSEGPSVLPYNPYDIEGDDDYDDEEETQILVRAVPLGPLRSVSPGPNIPAHRRGGPCKPRRLGNRLLAHDFELDARYPFPPRAPTANDINPLTGRRWTAVDLRVYPCGYPGLPACGRKGIADNIQRYGPSLTMTTPGPDQPVPVAGGGEGPAPHSLQSNLPDWEDESASALGFLWEGKRNGYRLPRDDEELRRLQAAREIVGNITANQLVGRWLATANDTPQFRRTTDQWRLITAQLTRPSWLSEVYARVPPTKARPTREKRIKAAREARKQAASGSSSAPTSVFGTPQPREVIPLDADQHMADATASAPSVSTATNPVLAQDGTEPRVIRGNVEGELTLVGSVDEPSGEMLLLMVDWMQQHPDVRVPGVIRSNDGSPMDEDALAGMYRIAQTGPASGRMTTVVEYLRLVQRYLIEYPNATLPGDHRYNAHYAGRLDSVPDVLAHFTSIATDGSTPADGGYDVVYDSTSVRRWIDAWAREVRVHHANNINQAEE